MTSLIPILGPRTRAHLDGTLGAFQVTLSQEQITRLDAASAVPLGTPHEQISGSAAAIAGVKRELLDLPAIPVT